MITIMAVTVPEGVVEFETCIWESDSKNNRHIDSTFYDTHYKEKPALEGVHHEIELIDHSIAMIKAHPHYPRMHIYTNPDGRLFIPCKTHLATLDEAFDLLFEWCVGTVYTMRSGSDYEHLKQRYNGSFTDSLLRRLEIGPVAVRNRE